MPDPVCSSDQLGLSALIRRLFALRRCADLLSQFSGSGKMASESRGPIAQVNPETMNKKASRATPLQLTQFSHALAAVCYLLSILIMMPLNPTMPAAELDSSWQYALNAAVSNQLSFGRDLIFTFGPLASAYTQQYSPATDTLMLLVSFVLGSAVFIGFAALGSGRASRLIAIPFVLLLFGTRDSIFMVLPLLMLLASESDRDTKWRRPTILFMGAACSLLPLIKGSLVAAFALCTVLATIALARRSWRDAALLVVIELGTMALVWVLVGQSLTDLPKYFSKQSEIIAGYTEAMSITGRRSEILIFIAVACFTLWTALKPDVRANWRILLAVAAVLFLNFKLGFVRHDGHAIIAGSALVLVGFVLWLYQPLPKTLLVLAASLGGWFFIISTYESVSPTALAGRLTTSLRHTAIGFKTRILNPEWLEEKFRASNDAIAKNHPLPISDGTVDLYPVDLSTLLANGATWSPRPILQSYSAYTRKLATENAEHLSRNGAQRVFFKVQPIDLRYPSLEDGSSWPVLLSKYEFKGFAGEYVVLDRSVGPAARVEIGEAVFKGTGTLGRQVSIPLSAPVWAEVDVTPTLLGKVVGLLFKLPPLKIVVHAADGSVGEYRFIAGPAKNGFLLSPMISNAREFVALRGNKSRSLLNSRRIISFGIGGAKGTRWLWNQSYALQMSPLLIEAAPGLDDVLLSEQEKSTSLDGAPVGGDCNIDSINGVTGNTDIQLGGDVLEVRGWAMISGTRGLENEGVAVVVADPSGETRVFRASKVTRPDVAAHFGQPHAQGSGFEALIDVSNLGPKLKIHVLQSTQEGRLLCGLPAVNVTRSLTR